MRICCVAKSQETRWDMLKGLKNLRICFYIFSKLLLGDHADMNMIPLLPKCTRREFVEIANEHYTHNSKHYLETICEVYKRDTEITI